MQIPEQVNTHLLKKPEDELRAFVESLARDVSTIKDGHALRLALVVERMVNAVLSDQIASLVAANSYLQTRANRTWQEILSRKVKDNALRVWMRIRDLFGDQKRHQARTIQRATDEVLTGSQFQLDQNNEHEPNETIAGADPGGLADRS